MGQEAGLECGALRAEVQMVPLWEEWALQIGHVRQLGAVLAARHAASTSPWTRRREL